MRSPIATPMTSADRESLRDAQSLWSSPRVLALFASCDLKAEVLQSYKRLRKHGQDPDSALRFALDDWDLMLFES